MTQLIIDGTEAVLGTGFSVVVKRENSIITKNGEYTYDCTLMLNNHVNRSLYGFLHRINKKGNVATKRSAVLIADGRVYCRGTEIITGWTDKEVKIQIVSGNSELNYFIGSSLMVEWLDMGEIEGSIRASWNVAANPVYGDLDFALPSVRNHAEGNTYNKWKAHGSNPPELLEGSEFNQHLRAQPYLCALIRRVITALGYTIGTNQLESYSFRNVIIINTIDTLKYNEMLPGWSVMDFLEEVERLCNCCFIIDNERRTCDIYLKSSFYQNARVIPLRKVVDAYEAEVIDAEDEYSTSDIRYDFDDGKLERLQNCEEMLGVLDVIECANFAAVKTALDSIATTDKKVAYDNSTGRYYIRIEDPVHRTPVPGTDHLILEVDTFAPLRRNDATNEVVIGIVPVPMIFTRRIKRAHYELKPIIGSDGNDDDIDTDDNIDDDTTDSDETRYDEYSVEDFIGEGTAEGETSKGKLYAAIYNGYHKTFKGWYPMCYTDAYTMEIISGLRYLGPGSFVDYYPNDTYNDEYVGSLRLQNLDTEIYNGAYSIDTGRSVTFEVYDFRRIDVRDVLNIHNKLWVVREIEETITAMGRKPKWKVTCHPINIVATGEQVEWVLEDGTWNDGNPWYDHGRWLDEPEE
jgi:hypothetical protein